MKVVMIGTGSGIGLYEHSDHDQAGPSVLLDMGDELLLFDAGRTALQNVFKSGYNPVAIDRLFLTHFHSDHTVGLPDLVISPWIGYGKQHWVVHGPRGTSRIIDALFGPDGAFDDDILGRCGSLDKVRPSFDVREITRSGSVCEGEGWEVLASFSPKHIQPWLTSIAYRVDAPEGSVVMTGDTGPHGEVAEFAGGCSVLIHDCAIMERKEVYAKELIHTDPRSLGRVAAQAGAETLIAYHFKTRTPEEIESMRESVSESYSGRFIVARDLLKVDVATGEIL
jgi:ribonuclease Z